MKAIYGWSIWWAPAIWCFYVPAGFIRYIVACLRCLWATAELQDSWIRGLSFQMGNFCFLPGTDVSEPHHLDGGREWRVLDAALARPTGMRVWRQGGVAAERACFQAPRASARWQQRSRAAWAAQQVANGSPVKFFSAAATAAEDKKEPESKGLLDKLADPFVNSKLFGPHTGQSPEGFTNRWLFVPPAMAAHLCIGAPWAWSALSGTLTREHGFVCSAASDWSLGDATYPMQLAFLMQGVGAALVGGWQLKVGMRSSMAVAVSLWAALGPARVVCVCRVCWARGGGEACRSGWLAMPGSVLRWPSGRAVC